MGYYPMMDWTYLLVLPGLLLGMWAQMKVKSNFDKYSSVFASRGATADSVSRALLDRAGLSNVHIERVRGSLTDHYDPRDKVLRLSDSVSGSRSIAAIGVAAHEVGHAIQDSEAYGPLRFRNSFVPIANIGSQAALPLFFIGLLMSMQPLLYAGIALFSLIVIFHLVTLPVELDASSRALKMLGDTGTLTDGELSGAKSVLSAAAMTYIAATVGAALQLLRLLMLANANRRRR